MTGAVTFDYEAWTERYSEFAAVREPLANLYFAEATIYCANKLNPVPTVEMLSALLGMVTAHIAALNSPTTAVGANPNAPPGRLSNATEGSVSATFDMDVPPGSAQWFAQTKYGAAFWQATLPMRLFRYKAPIPGPASFSQMPWLYPNTGS